MFRRRWLGALAAATFAQVLAAVPASAWGPYTHLEVGCEVLRLAREQELIDRSDIEHITVEDIRTLSENIGHQMERLSRLTDVIYIHIDMDVLDPREVPGHSLNVPDGPTSVELAAALTEMFSHEKVAALGIASTPSGERDPEGVSREAAYRLIEGALEGVNRR